MQPNDAAALIGVLIQLDRRRRRRELSYAVYIRLKKLIIAEFMLKKERP